jgi:hypothetical protein
LKNGRAARLQCSRALGSSAPPWALAAVTRVR